MLDSPAQARRLSVDADMKPVVAALQGMGLSSAGVCEVSDGRVT